MKKLALALVAVVALMAAPAMAELGDSGAVDVTITVEDYVAIQIAPDPLVMTVTDIQAPGGSPAPGTHEATTTFSAVGNAGFSVEVTPSWASNSVIYTPGSVGVVGDVYPTAYTGGSPNTEGTNGIGFGMATRNVTAGTPFDAWDPEEQSCLTAFSAGVSTGELKINTYLDSGRSGIDGPFGGELALPSSDVGDYTSVLTLTLIP